MLNNLPKQLVKFIIGSLLVEVYSPGHLDSDKNQVLTRIKQSLAISEKEFEEVKQKVLENQESITSTDTFHARLFLKKITPELLKFYEREQVSQILLELANQLELDSDKSTDKKGVRDKYSLNQYKEARLLLKKGHINKGVAMMEKIARLGNPDAQYTLGSLYMQGQFIKKNEDLARTWFQMASDNGHTASQGNLGIMYHLGLGGVSADQTLAFEYSLAAAQKGYAKSQLHLAKSYRFGWGTELDFNEAEVWYLKAARSGENIHIELAEFYMSEAAQLPESEKKAHTILVNGIEKGELKCVTTLAKLVHARKLKTNKNIISLLKKASEKGHGESSKILGDIYTQGILRKQDHNKACGWYAVAAKQGFMEGFVQLGLYFSPEIGIKPNARLASLFFHLAQDSSNPVLTLLRNGCQYDSSDFSEDQINNWHQFLPEYNLEI